MISPPQVFCTLAAICHILDHIKCADRSETTSIHLSMYSHPPGAILGFASHGFTSVPGLIIKKLWKSPTVYLPHSIEDLIGLSINKKKNFFVLPTSIVKSQDKTCQIPS